MYIQFIYTDVLQKSALDHFAHRVIVLNMYQNSSYMKYVLLSSPIPHLPWRAVPLWSPAILAAWLPEALAPVTKDIGDRKSITNIKNIVYMYIYIWLDYIYM